MDITLHLASDKMGDEALQVLLRDACERLNAEDNLHARLPTCDVDNSKGTLIELGLLALGWIGTDSGKVVVGFIKDLLLREKHLEVEIRQADGSSLKITAKNISQRDVQASLDKLLG